MGATLRARVAKACRRVPPKEYFTQLVNSKFDSVSLVIKKRAACVRASHEAPGFVEASWAGTRRGQPLRVGQY